MICRPSWCVFINVLSNSTFSSPCPVVKYDMFCIFIPSSKVSTVTTRIRLLMQTSLSIDSTIDRLIDWIKLMRNLKCVVTIRSNAAVATMMVSITRRLLFHVSCFRMWFDFGSSIPFVRFAIVVCSYTLVTLVSMFHSKSNDHRLDSNYPPYLSCQMFNLMTGRTVSQIPSSLDPWILVTQENLVS